MIELTKQTFIYGLAELDGSVRYVGQTSDPKGRWRGHIAQADEGSTLRVHEWIWSLLKQGQEPRLMLLEIVPLDGWVAKEQEWIDRLMKSGAGLLNMVPAGHGGDRSEFIDYTTEGRKEQARANGRRGAEKMRGIPRSPEVRRKIAEGRRRAWARQRAEAC